MKSFCDLTLTFYIFMLQVEPKKSISEQPATCPVCQAVLRQSRNLKRHLELKHFSRVNGKKVKKNKGKLLNILSIKLIHKIMVFFLVCYVNFVARRKEWNLCHRKSGSHITNFWIRIDIGNRNRHNGQFPNGREHGRPATDTCRYPAGKHRWNNVIVDRSGYARSSVDYRKSESCKKNHSVILNYMKLNLRIWVKVSKRTFPILYTFLCSNVFIGIVHANEWFYIWLLSEIIWIRFNIYSQVLSSTNLTPMVCFQ